MSENTLKSKEKLQWLGLSRAAQSLSDVKTEMKLLSEKLGDYDTFTNDLENGYDYDGDGTKESLDSFSAFDSYLASGSNSISFTQQEADSFIEKIRQNFSDSDGDGTVWNEFENYAINESSSFETLKTGFGSSNQIGGEIETEDGKAVAGLRFHESGGVTRNGVTVPAGTTEIFGQEIHFSQSGVPSSADVGSDTEITIDNISADPSAPDTGELVIISADVTNNYAESVNVTTTFTEDGEQIDNSTASINANSTETVSYTVYYDTIASHDYAISDSSEITVTWVPEKLTSY